ncbi:MAG TPA: HAD family acid phosphatase [Lacunisphaera sp.]|nr:HAD family acid phosphatase [Lacunisphaera sp.]
MKLPRLAVVLLVLRRWRLAGALAAVLALPASHYAVEPPNLDGAKREVYRYINSGEYHKDLGAVALKATKYLAKRLNKPAKPGEKLAVVFDIDETTLSNIPHMMANDFGYVAPVWHRYIGSAQAKAIVPVQVVYDMAIRGGIAVFFITARKESERAATERNLRDVGYETWNGIYFMADEDPDASPVAKASEPVRLFKTRIRKQLVNEGYTIILNIGDQNSDLAGGFAKKTFKLPNPIYKVN